MPTTLPTEPIRTVVPTASQLHISKLLNTVIEQASLPSNIRILDMGCGDTRLLAWLAQTLPARYPTRTFDFYGFEVGDIGWHAEGYLGGALEFLNKQAPLYDWSKRISVFSVHDPWPYLPQSFEIILSNQVLEHVRDHAFVFSEIRRCLAPHGISAHLFPLKETIYEVHAHMPFVHWIESPEQRARVMARFAQLGFKRKYFDEASFRGWTNLDEFGAIYSAVLEQMTNYKTSAQILEIARDSGFEPDLSYTMDFLRTKVQSIVGRQSTRYSAPGWIAAAALPFLKRLASVTLVLR